MGWKKLSEYDARISRGSILRTPAQPPFEDWVDFMLMDDWQSPSSFSLWICSGKQAGLPLIRIPKEATDKQADSIDRDWIIQNWQQWIHPDSKPEDVFVRASYGISKDWLHER